MLLYALVPVVILLMGGLVIIGAFVAAPSPEADLNRRVQLVAGANPLRPTADASAKAKTAAANAADRRSEIDRRARAFFAIGIARNWGMYSGALTLVLIAAVAGCLLWLLIMRVTGISWWLAAPAGLLAAILAPRLILLRQQRRAERQFMDMFPDAVDTIVRMLRAGLPMSAAVKVVGVEGSPPVSTIFSMLADQIKIGIPFEEALDTSSRQIGLADYRFFAVTVLLQYSTGGNIASTLDVLATIIRKRRAARMKAHSATAEIRLTAYVLGALPFATMGILLLLQPNYLTPLFNDPRGHIILGMAAGGLTASFLSMRMMMRSVTKTS